MTRQEREEEMAVTTEEVKKLFKNPKLATAMKRMIENSEVRKKKEEVSASIEGYLDGWEEDIPGIKQQLTSARIEELWLNNFRFAAIKRAVKKTIAECNLDALEENIENGINPDTAIQVLEELPRIIENMVRRSIDRAIMLSVMGSMIDFESLI